MNKVFLSGIIADHPVLVERADGNAHLVFSLCVRHRTQKGEVRKELYRINAWKNIARWAGERLGRGKVVALQGYLTQHAVRLGDGALVFRTDVTAEEFFSQTGIEAETNGKRPLDKMSPGNRGIRTKVDWNWTAAENLNPMQREHARTEPKKSARTKARWKATMSPCVRMFRRHGAGRNMDQFDPLKRRYIWI